MRTYHWLAAMACVAPAVAPAQSLATRVARIDGIAQVVFPSRAGACGDGRTYIGNLLGKKGDHVVNGGRFTRRGDWNGHPCVEGPVRVVVTVAGGEVTRIRTYVGPVQAAADVRAVDLGTVPVADAITWLSGLVARGTGRVPNEAMDALVAAEGSEPWPQLLAVARDDARPRDVRRQAMFWLGEATARRLGIADADAQATDDDDVKAHAVFALSQQPRDVAVPTLLRLARTATNGAVRKQAVFWLGQTGDDRAAELFAELLGLK